MSDFEAKVMGIFISSDKGLPMQKLDSVEAVAGVGLKGDRYAELRGAYSRTARIPDSDRQISLISLQAIVAANVILINRGKVPFDPEETRRNIVLDIEPDQLNILVGQRFFVGEVGMEGAELCDPCTRPAIVASRKADGRAFEEAFTGLGGLRARILNDGEIKLGDLIKYEENG